MNTTSVPCEKIAAQLGGMFTCARHEQYIRIRTPFLYPDGDVIDVYLVEQGGKLALTDFGESLRWLRAQTSGMRKSPRQKMLIHDVCITHMAELQNGMLVVKLDSVESIADGIVRIGQASSRVADLCFTMRTRVTQSATDEVEEYLRERPVQFDRGYTMLGESGKNWMVDFRVVANDNVSLVQVLSTGSRATAKNVVYQVVSMWTDIVPPNQMIGTSTKRVTLFDDTSDIWEPSDFVLVSKVSDDVARWSKPEDFDRAIRMVS